jgi:hypothetical protein
LLLFLMALGDVVPYHDRLATILRSSAYEDRLRLWKEVLNACPAYPIWGTGLGSFPVSHVPFLRHDPGGTIYNHSENEYVEWLVEGGLLGLGLLLALPLGTARLARAAWKSPIETREPALVLGAALALCSLFLHSFSDFALHTPPVALTAVILSAFLCKTGVRALDATHNQAPRLLPVRSVLAGLVFVGVAVAVVLQQYAQTRAEGALASVQLTELDLYAKASNASKQPEARTEDVVGALDAALGERPDWAQGHLMLASALIRLYEKSAADAIGESVKDPQLKATYSNPLWFHRQYHHTSLEKRDSPRQLLAYEPIAQFLVPAALEFLEARRSSPVMALPHAELASLDYLLQNGDSGEVYLKRAYRLAGAKTPVLELIAQIATQSDDLEIASKCWRSLLLSNPAQWLRYARVAGSLLPPDRVLDQVVPNAQLAVMFAEDLYTAPEDDPVRRLYFSDALRRLPVDASLSPAERLELEARAWQGLGDREKATRSLVAALALEPARSIWRKRLVEWLIDRGLLEEAHEQALIGLHFTPKDPLAQATFERANDLLARGKAAGAQPISGASP